MSARTVVTAPASPRLGSEQALPVGARDLALVIGGTGLFKHHADYSTPDAPANIPSDAATSTSVKYVKGVGPKLAELLAGKGIQTLDDLLHYLPFRYED